MFHVRMKLWITFTSIICIYSRFFALIYSKYVQEFLIRKIYFE